MPCTIHRISLAALIVSEKYLCDVPMKNKSWSAHSILFSLEEVNLMERQFLQLLNFNTHVSENELYAQLVLAFGKEQISLWESQRRSSFIPRSSHLYIDYLRRPRDSQPRSTPNAQDPELHDTMCDVNEDGEYSGTQKELGLSRDNNQRLRFTRE
ncbi:PHO85 cyclin-1 [Polyrhizophydium stewartii]|uniref:PHO85 cyclin-1 n=1 Tax=Polyrhizophydium stewartii TaxID=2732419 RepID=A0ABR4N272_9FUNG